MFRSRIPPRPTTVNTGFPYALTIKPQTTHFGFPCLWLLPLTPHQAAQSPTHPCIKFLDGSATLAHTEIVHPASQNRVDLIICSAQCPAPSLHTQFTFRLLESLNAGFGNADFACRVCSHAVPEELALPGPRRCALGFVHRQLEPVCKKPPSRHP